MITWYTKKGNMLAPETVRITLTKCGYRLSIGKEALNKITDNARLRVGLDGNRLYFGGDANGYKAVEEIHTYAVLFGWRIEVFNNFLGEYTLHHDAENHLYYIEK